MVSLIAALTKNHVIGKDNDLPWHLPDDMKYFMRTTLGHAVIMGRKNFDSSQAGYQAPGAIVVSSWDQALAEAMRTNDKDEIFVIGGAQIYKLALPHADRLYLTEIDTTLDGDTFFPAFEKSEWKERSRVHHAADSKHAFAFDFVVYDRRVKSFS
jgi:dihydrofolate reductase